MMTLALDPLLRRVSPIDTMTHVGRVVSAVGNVIEATLPNASVGAPCQLYPPGVTPVAAEVVGIRERSAILMPLGSTHGVAFGTRVEMGVRQYRVPSGRGIVGRVLDAVGEPIDGLGPLRGVRARPVSRTPLNPLDRRILCEPIATGIRSIDGLMTLAAGQRVAVVAGAGVGKTTLLTMIARHTSADITVLALIGERGGEVRQILQQLQRIPELASRLVVVASTSDEPAVRRVRAAWTATAIAEYFRSEGQNVLLLMDSMTRVAMAQREIGLAVGEAPATKGYPPSAFGLIPRLMERAGRTERGSITGIYTTLVEGDEIFDPVGDASIATADGHIVLSRALAEQGHFPAVDIRQSLSRTMNEFVPPEHIQGARTARRLLADREAATDLMSLGAYRPGANAAHDIALEVYPLLEQWLQQEENERAPLETTLRELERMRQAAEQAAAARGGRRGLGGPSAAPAGRTR
jgi:flagellum-specific ATP synthase